MRWHLAGASCVTPFDCCAPHGVLLMVDAYRRHLLEASGPAGEFPPRCILIQFSLQIEETHADIPHILPSPDLLHASGLMLCSFKKISSHRDLCSLLQKVVVISSFTPLQRGRERPADARRGDQSIRSTSIVMAPWFMEETG